MGYFLSKFNSDGTKAWSQNDLFGETWGDIAETAISISADGSIYIAGSAYGGLDGQSISGDMVLFSASTTVMDQRRDTTTWNTL